MTVISVRRIMVIIEMINYKEEKKVLLSSVRGKA